MLNRKTIPCPICKRKLWKDGGRRKDLEIMVCTCCGFVIQFSINVGKQEHTDEYGQASRPQMSVEE